MRARLTADKRGSFPFADRAQYCERSRLAIDGGRLRSADGNLSRIASYGRIHREMLALGPEGATSEQVRTGSPAARRGESATALISRGQKCARRIRRAPAAGAGRGHAATVGSRALPPRDRSRQRACAASGQECLKHRASARGFDGWSWRCTQVAGVVVCRLIAPKRLSGRASAEVVLVRTKFPLRLYAARAPTVLPESNASICFSASSQSSISRPVSNPRRSER